MAKDRRMQSLSVFDRLLDLAPDIAAEAVIEVDGEQWTVADVRPADGSMTQLICIYNV